MTRSYAKGMVALIFFVLAVQFAIFTIKSYENRGDVTTQYHEKDEPPVKPEIKADLAEKNNISFNSVINQIIEFGLENLEEE